MPDDNHTDTCEPSYGQPRRSRSRTILGRVVVVIMLGCLLLLGACGVACVVVATKITSEATSLVDEYVRAIQGITGGGGN